MNIYWLVAGTLMIIGGIMHTIIGEQNVISNLKTEIDKTFLTHESFNLIRWFWYLGSFISFWVGIVAIIIATTDGVLENERTIGLLLTSIMTGFSILTSGIVIILNPREIKKLSQIIILIVVTVLLLIGSI